MNRALRKRAGKLRDKAEKQLKKPSGSDLHSTALRLSNEQYVATLQPFAEGNAQSAGEFVTALAQRLMQESETVERLTEPRLMSEEEQSKIACGAGCSWCCRRALNVSILDAVSVAAYLLQNKISVELEDYLHGLESCGRDSHKLRANYARCPLLNTEDRCAVYPARPVVCRAFHSLDLEACRVQVEQADGNRDTPMYTLLFGLRGMRLSGAREALSALGLDDRPVVLARALKTLLEDFEGTCQAWLDGEPVFESAGVDE